MQELLNTGNVRVLDSGIEAKNNHFEKRIPKAKYFSIPEIRNSHSSLSQEVPGLDEFRGYMKRLGLKNDNRPVVVYDQTGFALAGRAWFLLTHFGYPNVRILDGGLVKWLAENRAVETGVYEEAGNSNESDEDYQLVEANNDRVFFDELKPLTISIRNHLSQTKIWDPRPAEMYNQGSVDQAINIPVGTFFLPNKTIKSQQEVASILEERLGNQEIITSCTKGNLASLAFALLKYAGKNNARIYSGSFEEWKSLST